VINCCPNPKFITLVANESLEFIKVYNFGDFLELWHIRDLATSFPYPVDNSSLVDSRDSLNAPQSHTIEVHFQPQLLNIVRIFPIAIAFEELATAMLAFVAQSVSTMTILIEIP
jgi:hypothetical protein